MLTNALYPGRTTHRRGTGRVGETEAPAPGARSGAYVQHHARRRPVRRRRTRPRIRSSTVSGEPVRRDHGLLLRAGRRAGANVLVWRPAWRTTPSSSRPTRSVRSPTPAALDAGDDNIKALSIRGRRCTSSRFEMAPELWQVLSERMGWPNVETVTTEKR